VTDLRVRLSAVIVVVALVGLILPIAVPDDGNSLSRLRNALAQPWISALLTGLVALIVTHWWRPCVGIELGSILTAAPDDPIGQLPATVGFMLGISIPLLLVALTFVAARPTGLFAGRLAWGGATLCTVLAVSVIAGQHGEIVSRLFQWSQ
jgi:cytochrome c-type biogenesis protein